jgi:hypothetical protein
MQLVASLWSALDFYNRVLHEFSSAFSRSALKGAPAVHLSALFSHIIQLPWVQGGSQRSIQLCTSDYDYTVESIALYKTNLLRDSPGSDIQYRRVVGAINAPSPSPTDIRACAPPPNLRPMK